MNIRIGDMVRFLTEKLEGKVTAIVDHSTVNVYVDEYGFEIPASVRILKKLPFPDRQCPVKKQCLPFLPIQSIWPWFPIIFTT